MCNVARKILKRKEMEQLESKDTALLIHIKHSQPIEVENFVSMMRSVNTLYSSFAKENAQYCEQQNAKLYVKDIKEGSIDIILCDLAVNGIIPFMENINLVWDFSNHIKKAINYFAKQEGNPPKYTLEELKALKDFFNVTANDRDSSGSISVVDVNEGKQRHTFNNCTFNFGESNSGQNIISKEIDKLSDVPCLEELRKRQLMTIYQMAGNLSSDKGNKAIISAITSRKVGLVFETDELKQEILGMDSNPTKKAFLVDVILQYVGDRLAAYKVTALHDIIDLDEES